MALNLGMLGSYDQIKESLVSSIGSHKMNNIISSLVAGVLAALFSLPFDNIKTKIHRMSPDVYGIHPYKGVIDCAIKTYQNEGVRGFFAGYVAYNARIIPKVGMVLLMVDILKYLFGQNA